MKSGVARRAFLVLDRLAQHNRVMLGLAVIAYVTTAQRLDHHENRGLVHHLMSRWRFYHGW